MWHVLWESKTSNIDSVQWTCPGQTLLCSVQHRCGICGVCHGPMLPCQWGQRDANYSPGVCRYVHMLKSLDVHEIVKAGGAGVRSVGEVDTIGGLAWMGRNR